MQAVPQLNLLNIRAGSSFANYGGTGRQEVELSPQRTQRARRRIAHHEAHEGLEEEGSGENKFEFLNSRTYHIQDD